MSKQLFKKSKIEEKFSSPEQLNGYVRVTNPGVWMVISAIIILLCGVIAWGIVGKIDTTMPAVIVADDENAVIYVCESEVEKLGVGMTVVSEEKKYTITDISKEPIRVDGSFSDYIIHASGIESCDWVYAVSIDGEHSRGVHKANIVIESISPISFILN